MPSPSSRPVRIHWFARLEHRFHAWRERRARRRGRTATVVPFPGYGGPGWIRVVGRVLILPKTRGRGKDASVRGWRSFVGIPVSFATVTITVAGRTHEVAADRGGVIDCRIEADLPSGWQQVTMSVEGQEATPARIFVVAEDVRFGVVSDVDDTVMVTALPRPLIAAWNSFVVDEHARTPVPGMAVLLERLMRDNPGSPMIYLSTGAWNVAPTLNRFLSRHLFPAGSMLLTDWGPTHERWFRSGREHKLQNLGRLAEEFPHMRWLLIGDDGQHDEAIYGQFLVDHPENVAAVAIRRLLPAEGVLAGRRAAARADGDAADAEARDEDLAPWVSAEDGAGILDELIDVGVVHSES